MKIYTREDIEVVRALEDLCPDYIADIRKKKRPFNRDIISAICPGVGLAAAEILQDHMWYPHAFWHFYFIVVAVSLIAGRLAATMLIVGMLAAEYADQSVGRLIGLALTLSLVLALPGQTALRFQILNYWSKLRNYLANRQ